MPNQKKKLETIDINGGFKKHFNTTNKFMDNMGSMLAHDYRFDVIAFDEWCISKHDYDIDKHGSTKDFVTSKFGKEALEFILKLLA